MTHPVTHIAMPLAALYAPDYPLQTARLLLRPFNRGDVDAVFAYRSRGDVSRYLSDLPMNHDECTEAVRARTSQIAFMAEGDKIVLAVERAADGLLIGEVSFIWRSVADGQAEIGYVLDPAYHGQGYATEAGNALLQFGFGTVGLHRIYARCDARNDASWHVMERLGMRREAHFREHVQAKGHWYEELIYAVLATDPPMTRAVLYHGVARGQCHLGPVVEFEHDGALEHHLEVNGVRGVHAGIRWIHVAQQSGQLALDVGHRVLDVAEVLLGRACRRWNRQHSEAEAPDGWEVGAPVLRRTVVGELRRRVAAPQLVELGRGEQRRPVRLDGLIARDTDLPDPSCPVTTRRTPIWSVKHREV